MTNSSLTFDASDGGKLTVHTGVEGRAAKMGHRLTIAMTSWRAEVEVADGVPTAVSVTVDVDSADVVSGEGGVTPLLGPEKMVARSNTLKTFDAKKFPTITFQSQQVESADDGYNLTGTVQIHGKSRDVVVPTRVVDTGDRWTVTSEAVVRQTDFDIKPYSQLLGAMKVADDVTVKFAAEVTKPGK